MIACLVMALGGFLVFGDKTLGNVLNNFPSDNIMVNVARLFFGLNMLTTLPLEAFVCREVMVEYWWPEQPFNLRRHLVISTGLVAAATFLSLITCDLGAVFELVGATSAVAMAYILPPMCYIKLTTRSWRTYVAATIVVFGGLVMVISVIQAVQKLVYSKFPRSRFICKQTLTREQTRMARRSANNMNMTFAFLSHFLYIHACFGGGVVNLGSKVGNWACTLGKTRKGNTGQHEHHSQGCIDMWHTWEFSFFLQLTCIYTTRPGSVQLEQFKHR